MMRSKFIIGVLLFFFSILSSGCVPLFVGAAVGVAGGYAASRDTIQGETDKDYDSLWKVAVDVVRMEGAVVEEDITKGYLKVEVDSGYATVQLVRLTKSTTRIRIKARKAGFPNLRLAEDMYIRILEGAK